MKNAAINTRETTAPSEPRLEFANKLDIDQVDILATSQGSLAVLLSLTDSEAYSESEVYVSFLRQNLQGSIDILYKTVQDPVKRSPIFDCVELVEGDDYTTVNSKIEYETVATIAQNRLVSGLESLKRIAGFMSGELSYQDPLDLIEDFDRYTTALAGLGVEIYDPHSYRPQESRHQFEHPIEVS